MKGGSAAKAREERHEADEDEEEEEDDDMLAPGRLTKGHAYETLLLRLEDASEYHSASPQVALSPVRASESSDTSTTGGRLDGLYVKERVRNGLAQAHCRGRGRGAQ